MLAVSLQSGSNGNCIYVEAGGVRLLFDAGIAGSLAERRLKACGRDIRDVDALFISHDHADHVRCAGIYQRKFGIPIYATPGTLHTALSRHPLGKLTHVEYFRPGGAVSMGGVTVQTIPTTHDSAEGAAFVVEADGRRLGILTDLGHPFAGLDEIIGSLDAVFIESNYDPGMLAQGSYPPSLKQRIRGPRGHLSNAEAAELVARCGSRLAWVCIAHLSENNNSPALALRTNREIIGEGLSLHLASRYCASDILRL
jgi:phosphoribosyl 1,2-cyclic phosphodiesterase